MEGEARGVVPGRFQRTELPVEDGREELRDQPLIIWLKLLGFNGFVGFGVEVVRVEGPNGSQRLLICLVGQMAVRVLPVPPGKHETNDMRNGVGKERWKNDARVKAVVSNHMEASLGETALVLQHAVEVLQGRATDQHQSIAIDDQGCERESTWSRIASHTNRWISAIGKGRKGG